MGARTGSVLGVVGTRARWMTAYIPVAPAGGRGGAPGAPRPRTPGVGESTVGRPLDAALVRRLLAAQFPRWAGLPSERFASRRGTRRAPLAALGEGSPESASPRGPYSRAVLSDRLIIGVNRCSMKR
ncbi:hypothetical protein JBF12_24905 [Streptomyces javensis]|uniref:Uncharacterized protein n=1 Tax=Streptomyces javensis TaxID=114698 RepID=A0ABS0RGD5_9ACTN|nr:hypothetical protein [Streptomyces javensis]